MAATAVWGALGAMRRVCGPVAASACCLLFAACAQIGGPAGNLFGTQTTTANGAATSTGAVATGSTGPAASTAPAAKTPVMDTRAELVKATEFWGNALAKNPTDPQTALNYARNLKALGERQQALAILQQAAAQNPGHRGILGEYGRLALEMNQVTLSQKLLEQADDPANPDWKVISARGTALARQGLYRDASKMYERALVVAPDQASVVSNLALSYAMEGNAEKAEPMLRRAVAMGATDPRINQNLALILGLQGKYDEAKLIAGRDLPPDGASSNIDYVEKMVQLQGKPIGTAKAETPVVADKVAAADKAAAAAPKAKDGKPAAAKEAKITAPVARAAAVDRAADTAGWSTHVAVAKP
jgi:Flp pilus assembly protein TadD